MPKERCPCGCVCGVCKGCACPCHALFDALTGPALRAIVLMHGETCGKSKNETLFNIANAKKRGAILKTVRKSLEKTFKLVKLLLL